MLRAGGLALFLQHKGATAECNAHLSTGVTAGGNDGILKPWWPHGSGLPSSPFILFPISRATLLVPTEEVAK